MLTLSRAREIATEPKRYMRPTLREARARLQSARDRARTDRNFAKLTRSIMRLDEALGIKNNDAYGMSCFNCDAEVSGRDHDDVERKASAAGWMIGLMTSGQAYYGCTECGPCLYNARRLVPQERRTIP